MNVELQRESLAGMRFPGLFKITSSSQPNSAGQVVHDPSLGTLPSVVVAHEGSRLVGMGEVVTRGVGQASIESLIVDPEFRGLGIGRQLLQALIGLCEQRHLQDIRVSATRSSRGFFERNGFVALPESESEMQYSGSWEALGNTLGLEFVPALELVELEALAG